MRFFCRILCFSILYFWGVAASSAENSGSFISASRQSLPNFPATIPGFYHESGKDFWGKPFEERGTIRLFDGSKWEGIPEFPSSSNGCGNGRFMVRWRSANPDVVIKAGISFGWTSATSVKDGMQGYIVGSNCHSPVFKFSHTKNGNQSNLVDVYYEVKFWRAGV
jgi:hypothetical protein